MTTHTYDNVGNRLTTTDANNKTTTYTYDNANNLLTTTAPDGGITSYTYDDAGNQITETNPRGYVTTKTYDDANRLTSVTTPEGNKTTYFYDVNGNLVKTVDPRGNAAGANPDDFDTIYTYDAAGRMLTETNPLGKTTTYTYDAVGNRTSVTDAKNHTTTFVYDDQNRLLTKTAPDTGVTTFTYDGNGNELTRTDERGKVWTSSYDDAGRLISTTDPLGKITTHSYDANGNLTGTVDPRGNETGATPADYKTTFAYDRAGRKTSETDPLGNATSFTYDDVGNQLSVTNARNKTTSYEYDGVNRLKKVIAPGNHATVYTYDLAGNVTKRTDPKLHEITYVYDKDNRRTSLTWANGSQWTYTYDRAGNLITKVDANGNATGTAGDGTTTHTYNAANQLTAIDYSDSTPDVSFAYDSVGNRTSMTDGSGTKTWTYDNDDRVLTATRGSDTFSYEYDLAGNITKRTYPDNTVVDYTYDNASRMASVTSGTATTGYSYDAAGNLTTTTLPSANGHVETRTYDRAGRLTYLKAAKGSTVLDEFTYTLDPVGNPTTIIRGGHLTQTATFAYDDRDQITEVCYQLACPNGSDPFIRWTYDAMGNRLTEARPTGTMTYTYNSADQLTSDGTNTFTYDANGNRTGDGSRTFTYDLANRMKTSVDGSVTTTFVYDGDGQRMSRSDGTAMTKYLWDEMHRHEQIALERDGGGNLLRRYTYGHRRLTLATSSATSYYHYDSLGSVVTVTSGTGVTQWTHWYEPFGDVRLATQDDPAAPANEMLFAGERLDDSGLYHLRARDYDSAVGRFVSVDPAEAEHGDPAVATYHYGANRPTVMVDPSGRTFEPSNIAADSVDLATSGGSTTSRSPMGASRMDCGPLWSLSCLKGWFVQEVIEWKPRCAYSTTCLLRVEFNVLSTLIPQVRTARVGARLGFGNVHGGFTSIDPILRGAEKWLGRGYREIAPGVFRSKDGLRQFRMKSKEDLGHAKPHVHFESIAPDGRTILENSHVYIKGKR